MPTTFTLNVDCIALDSMGEGALKAPTEFRIFRKGDNESTKGIFRFTEAAAKMVMDRFRAMAGPKLSRRITFDYDHGSLNRDSRDPSETAKSAGDCLLELRDGELWAIDVRFTPKAKAGIEAREWLYFSPAFNKNAKSEPQWLINIAICNNPALFAVDQLAEAASALFPSVVADLAAEELAASDAADTDPGPVKAACAVVAGKHHDAGKYLTVGMADGTPAFPGGWLKDGETAEQCAVRETLEETGYKVIAIRRLHTGKDEDGNMAAAVECQIASHDREPLAAGEHGAVRWLSHADVITLTRYKGFNDSALRELEHPLTALGHQGVPKGLPADHAPKPVQPQAGGGGAAPEAGTTPDTRREMARKSATQWAANNLGTNGPVGLAPDHDAASMPLTFQYPSPQASGGWIGCMEPPDGTWICFVTQDGKCALWDRRNPDGSTQGAPLLFQRDVSSLLPPPNETAASKLHNDNHDANGQFGSGDGGGGSAATVPSSQVGADHGGGMAHAPTEPAVTTGRGDPAKAKAAEEGARAKAEQAGRDLLKEFSAGESAKASARAAAATAAAKKSGSPAAHDRAGNLNRVAAGQHDVAVKHDPEHAEAHRTAAASHRQAAEHHEAHAGDMAEAASAYLAIEVYANPSLLAPEDLAQLSAPVIPPPEVGGDDPLNYPSGPPTHDAPSTDEAARATAALKLSQDRNAKALASAQAWATGEKAYAVTAPRQTCWRAILAPLSGRYPDPAKVGGWIGWIENAANPADDTVDHWIAFVAADGLMLLWQDRDANGGVVGNPVQMWRSLESLTATGETMPEALMCGPDATPQIAKPADYDWQRDNALAMAESRIIDPELKFGSAPDHPAATAPLTGRFTDPLSQGKGQWIGWICPANGAWICFVSMDGRALLWTERRTEGTPMDGRGYIGAGVGDPIAFKRDLATLSVTVALAVQRRQPGGAFSFGKTMTPGDGGLVQGVSRRADLASHMANTPELHKAAAAVNRDVATDHLGVAADHRQLAGDTADKADHHIAEAKLHEAAAKLHSKRADKHDAAAAAGSTTRLDFAFAVDKPQAVRPLVAAAAITPSDTSGAAPADPTPTPAAVAAALTTTENTTTMHPKLAAYAATNKLDTKGLEARCLKAVPPAFEKFIKKGTSEDPKDHPDEKTMSAVMNHLKALDDMEADDDADGDGDSPKEKTLKAKLRTLKAELSVAKALTGSPIERAAEGKLSIAALTSLGVAAGLQAEDAAQHPDRVIRVACDAIEGARTLCATFGVNSLGALEGKLEALRADATAGALAVTKLAAIETQRAHDTAALSVTTAEKEGRLTPAKRTKADTLLGEKKYEALSAFLSACDVIPAFVPPIVAPTQLSVEQNVALRNAGVHPSATAGLPPPPGLALGTASATSPAELPADDAAALKVILADHETLSIAKGLGILDQPAALREFGAQLLADRRGVTVTDVIAKLSAVAA